MRLFGKKKKKGMSPEQTLKTMENLRQTIQNITKRSNLLQNKAQNQLKQALERKKQGDKSGALICLKRNKMYKNEITKLEGSRMNLQQQLFAIQGASMNKNIFDALKTGNEALKTVHGKINIEQVDKLKDDMEQQQDLLQELNDAISQPVGFMSTVDDDQLLDELDQLEAREYELDMLDVEAPNVQVNPAQRVTAPQVSQPAPVQDDLEDMFNDMQMT